ncbi:MAG: hypothetical protein H6842_04625 [Rhodospirillaceae bacterium]|nr:hypothetical protein [Rhodospirillaceae bacterium]
MNADQFCRLLGRLNLNRAGQHTAKALGISLRQLQRYTAGTSPIPEPVALLAIAYVKLGGVPAPLWDTTRDKYDIMRGAARRLGSPPAMASSSDPATGPRMRAFTSQVEDVSLPARKIDNVPRPVPPADALAMFKKPAAAQEQPAEPRPEPGAPVGGRIIPADETVEPAPTPDPTDWLKRAAAALPDPTEQPKLEVRRKLR